MSVSNTTKRVKEIRRKTRRKFSSEEKIRIVLEGLRGECSIASRISPTRKPPLVAACAFEKKTKPRVKPTGYGLFI